MVLTCENEACEMFGVPINAPDSLPPDMPALCGAMGCNQPLARPPAPESKGAA